MYAVGARSVVSWVLLYLAKVLLQSSSVVSITALWGIIPLLTYHAQRFTFSRVPGTFHESNRLTVHTVNLDRRKSQRVRWVEVKKRRETPNKLHCGDPNIDAAAYYTMGKIRSCSESSSTSVSLAKLHQLSVFAG
jgi:hypothetical protein